VPHWSYGKWGMDRQTDENMLIEESTSAAALPAITAGYSAEILMMLLDEGDAASVLQHLTPAEV